MSKYIKVSDFKVADDLFMKTQKINIEGKILQTPIKTIDASKLHPDIQIVDKVKGLNEICKFFNGQRLEEYVTGAKDESLINIELARKIRNTNHKEAIICFVGYEDLKFPDEKGINFLMNLAHEFSDATPLPLVPKLFKNDERDFYVKLNDYKVFMKKCIDSINRFNNKPILGIIPEIIPSTYVADLVNFYYDNDITSFVYDFKGKVSAGMRTKIREMMIALKELDLLGNSFLYSINVNNGKMIKDASIVRARDILTFGFGFDALGDQHIRRVFPPDVAKMIRERMINSSPLIRLFNNKDYGYYKTSDLSMLENIYPKDETSIPFDNFRVFNTKAKHSQTLFNSERIGLEAMKYQRLIIEETDKTSDYFKTKKYVREKDIKDLVKFRRELKI
jgi:hypothetical protein